MTDEEIVRRLRSAPPGSSAVELAELLDQLTNGGLTQGAIVTYFKRAFPSIPLKALRDAEGWKRVSQGSGLDDDAFNAVLDPHLRAARPTSFEVDLSRATGAQDIHAAFATALGFPEWYGRNWDAFWDLISSDHPLPDQLHIRGLDHVEQTLPREADLMLRCLGDYNNRAGRWTCSVSVTEDYYARMYFLAYEGRPGPALALHDVVGAIIHAWIKAGSAREANQRALERLDAQGWEVVSHDEMRPVDPRQDAGADNDFVRQACIDGAVFHLRTYGSEE
jgi:RNAse (barnase) inhibitor barstar